MTMRLGVAVFGLLMLAGGPVGVPGVGVGPTMRNAAGLKSADSSSFDLGFGGGGISALSSSLTINGVAMQAKLRCEGKDADTDSWNCTGTDAEDFAEAVDVGAGFNSTFPTAAASDKAVQFNAAGYYRSAGTTNGQFSTGDIVAEWVGTWVDASQFLYSTNNGPGTTGVSMITHNSNLFRVTLADSGGTCTINSATGLVDSTAIHVMFFANRDEASTSGTQIYINGVASGAGVDCSAKSGTLAGVAATIGARGNNTLPYSGAQAYLSLWERADWHQSGAAGPTEWAAIAKERFAKLTGLWPDKHNGTAVPDTISRASSRTVFKSGEMFMLGDNWLSTIGGTYSAEGAITNTLIQSDDLTTSWTELNAPDTTDTAGNGDPYGTDVGDGIIADNTNIAHGYTQAATVTAATWTLSIWTKAGDNSYVYLQDETVANTTTYFNVSTCAVGTTGSAVLSTFAESATSGDWVTGWCRVGIAFTGTAASHTFRIASASADNTLTFAGDGATISTVFAGAQLELSDHPTSYMPTVLSTATRNAGLLQYKMDDGNYGDGNGAIGTAEVIATCVAADAQNAATTLMLSDGGAAADSIEISITSADVAKVTTAKTAGNAGSVTGTTDIVDGASHTVRATWTTDSLALYVDGVAEGVVDTSIDPPVAIDEDDEGSNSSDAQPLNCDIDRTRIWTTVKAP